MQSPDDIKRHLEKLAGWELKEEKIVKSYSFASFREAVEFANDVADIAEERNHHPIITISWKTVGISSVSFDVGHLTERDFGLAGALDEMYRAKYQDKLSQGDDQDSLLLRDEEKERARLRTRGPYRKSSGAGLDHST